MKILDVYIGQALLRGILLVALILLPLITLLDLAQQLDNIGTGNYGLVDALIYEVLLLPGSLLSLMPFIALLGSSIALGSMAQSKELTAMRAAGISIRRIGLSTIRTGALVMLVVIVIMEWVDPPLHQLAIKRQTMALTDVDVLIEEHGLWIHKDNRLSMSGKFTRDIPRLISISLNSSPASTGSGTICMQTRPRWRATTSGCTRI